MIIKFALGNNAYEVFPNVSKYKYKERIWLPKVGWNVAIINKDGSQSLDRFTLCDLTQTVRAEGDPELSYDQVAFDPRNPAYLYEFILKDKDCAFENSHRGRIVGDEEGVVCHVITHERPHQVRYNLVTFWHEEREYFILSSMPVYICNDAGKTTEMLRL